MNRKLRQAASLTMSTIILTAQPGAAVMAQPNEYIEASALEGVELNNSVEEIELLMDAVVYTQSTASNDSKIGNGSRENPYNRFEDAVANVADGGTIIIKSGNSAFLNTQDEAGLVPFIIDKNITIKSEADDIAADLVVRAGGIVLQGDVTFENINFAFANKVHDSIIANGYSLELIDCSRQEGTREIDLFAGRLYDLSGKLIKGAVYDANGNKKLVIPAEGDHASISIVSTTKSIKTEFGKVFAGSTNGTFDQDVQINVENNGSLDIREIYSCGAEETIVGSMFDLVEPEPPLENPAEYTVDGNVKIQLSNYKTDIHGAGSRQTEVKFKTEYPLEHFNLKDIDGLSVVKGKIIPTSISWHNDLPGDLEVGKGAELGLAKISRLEVANFIGGGKLTLQKEGHLVIHEDISGTTVFQTVGGAVDGSYSGLVQNEHVYIEVIKDMGDKNSFTYTPYASQKGYLFIKDGMQWKAQKGDDVLDIPDSISSVDFVEISTTWNIDGPNLPEIEFTLDPDLQDALAAYNLVYDMYINGEQMVACTDNQGYDYWVSEKYKIRIDIGADKISDTQNYYYIMCEPYTNSQGLFEMPNVGTYELQIKLPLYNIKANTTLKIVDDEVINNSQIKDSVVTMDMSVDGMSLNQSPAIYGKKLAVDIAVSERTRDIMPLAFENELELVVNGKVIGSRRISNNNAQFEVDITQENNFKVGKNDIKVLFGGSDVLGSAFTNQVLEVEKVTPSAVVLGNIQQEYNGKPVAANINIQDQYMAQPVIYYYTDSQYTTGKTSQAPINAGTYYVEVYLPESEVSKEVTHREGTITITKTAPTIKLSGDIIHNAGADSKDLKVWADMIYPKGGSTPIGQIKFECTDGNTVYSVTENLSFGTASHVFKDLPVGSYEITVSYIPEIEGYVDVNYVEGNGAWQSFEIVNDQAPQGPVKVTGISLNKSHLSLNKQASYELIAIITPNDAGNKNVIWSSSDSNIASVNNEGKITGHQKGTTIISATTVDGDFSASCTVEVVEASSGGGGGGGGSSAPSTPSSPNTDSNKNTNSTLDTENKSAADENTATDTGCSISVFSDAMSSWAKEDIEYVVEKGLFKGISEDSFGSDIPMTRGMIVTVLHRMAGLPSGKAHTKTYKDVKENAYYSAGVEWANAANIVKGMKEDKFAPNENVTREQLAVFLYRYALSMGLASENSSLQKDDFKDTSNISNWAKEAVYWATGQGILVGSPDGKLKPRQTATRAEVAAMIHRFCTQAQ